MSVTGLIGYDTPSIISARESSCEIFFVSAGRSFSFIRRDFKRVQSKLIGHFANFQQVYDETKEAKKYGSNHGVLGTASLFWLRVMNGHEVKFADRRALLLHFAACMIKEAHALLASLIYGLDVRAKNNRGLYGARKYVRNKKDLVPLEISFCHNKLLLIPRRCGEQFFFCFVGRFSTRSQD